MTFDERALRVPGPVIELARTLQDAGFPTWCVGGAVRDALLGLPLLDWDLATAATPAEVRRLFRRTIPVGIEFGTVGVLDRDGRMHEVTTFRRDVQTDGRHAVVEFGASLDQDLARRDFTINAIAFDPIARRLHDPFAGREDLVAGVVRAVGVAEERMREDRLRALRAIRFASRFGFSIDADTWQAIRSSASHLTRLSPERVKQEIDKTLDQVEAPSQAFGRWRDAGAFAAVVPALRDVSDDTLAAIDRLPRPGAVTRPLRRSLRLAALFSELEGKEAERALKALRASNQEIGVVGIVVDRWRRFGAELTAQLTSGGLPGDPALRRMAADIGRLRVNAFLRLGAALWAGDTRIAPAVVRQLFRRLMRIAFRDPIEVADLAVDGDDLRQHGLRAGPELGRVLQKLRQLVIDDPARNTRDELLRLAADLVASPSGAEEQAGS
ncbi:MAG TPA: hypothetical protein VGE27_01045 [Gemmatimonas sp.]|uniref:CCA tRNA nucleotidyltransferase n=1 Tax=Gemmatimonas sp. TaxID=1962908 RepID=UPI002ED9DF98